MNKIEDFKLVKNKQRPNACFSYELENDNEKLSIFTMNGGVSYLASKQARFADGKLRDVVNKEGMHY